MKKLIIAVCTSLLVASAMSAVYFVEGDPVDRGWQLIRGRSNVGTPVTTLEQCWDAARMDAESMQEAANYRCVNTVAGRLTWEEDPVVVDPPPPPPPTGSLMPFVDVSKIPSASVGYSDVRMFDTTEVPSPGGGIGAFRTECDFSHMNFDDPLLYPGQVGKSHLHAFFGNTLADANSTAESLANTGNTTCRGGIINRTAYWVPAMVDTTDGTPIRPTTANFYYKTGYFGVAPEDVQPMPEGLRMIAGDPKNAEPGGVYDRVAWVYSCDDGSSNSRSIPNCSAGHELWQTVHFPQCWDGVNLDSPDHKSHMAYADNGCPASHPVALPEITFNIVYMIEDSQDTSKWRLSSDNYDPSQPGGYSSHGDWFNGWRPDIMDTFVKGCDQTALDCHSHLLGDGRAIY